MQSADNNASKNTDKNANRAKNIKRRLYICFALVVVVLLIASSFSLSGVFARYTTGDSGTADAGIANYTVEATLANGSSQQIQQFNLAASSTSQEYKITVKNSSDVSVVYTVTLTNVTGNLPLKLSLTPDGGSAVTSQTGENSVSLSPTTALTTDTSGNTATVTIAITLDTTAASYDYNSIYREIDRVSVTVTFAQASTITSNN